MALVPNKWAITLYGNLLSKGFIGNRLMEFCEAVAFGSTMSVIGKTFNTVDVGVAPGVGAGTGIGVKGIPAPVVQSAIIGLCAGMGFAGSRMPDVADAVAQTLVSEMMLATLTSVHGPVAAGAGTVIPGSIPVIAPQWSSNITAQGVSRGFIGTHWPMYATALGTGQVAGFPTATGNVVIAGAPVGIPFGGGGVGVGAIT